MKHKNKIKQWVVDDIALWKATVMYSSWVILERHEVVNDSPVDYIKWFAPFTKTNHKMDFAKLWELIWHSNLWYLTVLINKWLNMDNSVDLRKLDHISRPTKSKFNKACKEYWVLKTVTEKTPWGYTINTTYLNPAIAIRHKSVKVDLWKHFEKVNKEIYGVEKL